MVNFGQDISSHVLNINLYFQGVIFNLKLILYNFFDRKKDQPKEAADRCQPIAFN